MTYLDRRGFIGQVAAATGAAVAHTVAHTAPAVIKRRGRPNIVFIMADDLGYGDLSGYGRADLETPVLDHLATEGLRFTHAYSAAAICTPTRVGFMTGRYPARHPVGLREPLTVGDEDRGLGLEPRHPTVPSLLKGSGYTNALFGKWHLGLQPEFHPVKHGFDEFFGPLSGAVDHVAHVTTGGEPDLWDNDRRVHEVGYLQDLVVDRAVAFIRRRPEPFFLSIQGTAPHWPWQRRGDAPVGQPGLQAFRSGPGDRYPDMVRILDEGVGRVLRALADTGVVERTLVVFTSDNGGELYSSMGGLAGRKGSTWEGGIRVPAFARWAGVIPAGVSSPQALTTLDWAATILSAAGVGAASDHPLDGIDLLPTLTRSRPAHARSLFWRTDRARQGAARSGTWKYHRDDRGERLFDLALDPGERVDRKEDEPELFSRLRSAYERWNDGMLPPLPRGAVAEG